MWERYAWFAFPAFGLSLVGVVASCLWDDNYLWWPALFAVLACAVMVPLLLVRPLRAVLASLRPHESSEIEYRQETSHAVVRGAHHRPQNPRPARWFRTSVATETTRSAWHRNATRSAGHPAPLAAHTRHAIPPMRPNCAAMNALY